MSKCITNRISLCSILAVALLSATANQSLAGGSDCVDNGTFNVCVEWSNGDDPVLTSDYDVTFHGAVDGPDLDLLKGNDGWIVYCELVSSPGTPADIGAFKTTGDDNNYTVKILNGSAAGFANVGSAFLVPAGGKSSSIAGLSKISGDLGGLTLVDDGGTPPQGGELAGLVVTGNLTGPLSVSKVTSPFNRILGNVTENADIEIGEITAGEFHITGNLVCNAGGTVCPDITVTGRIHDGLLTVEGNVPGGSTIRIEELIEPNTGITEASFSGAGDFAGTLVLPNGLANPHTRVYMANDLSGVIDLVGGDVAGELAVYAGTATAEIKNGGVVSGDVYLSESAPMQPNDYAGTATFVSVSATGEIGTLATAEPFNGQLSGEICVTGNMLGLIEIAGSVLTGGVIDIGGSMTGAIDIEASMRGTILVADDVRGDIHLHSDLSTYVSSISVGGSLNGRGRILVDEWCDGSIAIGEDAGSSTLIHCQGGLAANAKIKINTTAGNFNANGDIHVGVITYSSLPDVTFDGCIRIFKQAGGNGGDLTGKLTVVGCHADSTDLNICIDGGDGAENITIDDAGCANQPEHSCGNCT